MHKTFLTKHLQSISLLTSFVFLFFTMTHEFCFGQNVDLSPLIKAQGLYRTRNFVEAIKVLDAFIREIQNNPTENKRLAEAYYLLARINYDSGEDAKTDDLLKRSLAAHDQIGKRETNLDFKARLDQVKEKYFKIQSTENKIVQVAPQEISKIEEAKSKNTETEKELLKQNEMVLTSKTTSIQIKQEENEKKEKLIKSEEIRKIEDQKKPEEKTKLGEADQKPNSVIKQTVKIKQIQVKKKKKFPWYLAILGAGIVIALIVILSKKKSDEKYTLTVHIGNGVSGTPDEGNFSYSKGDVVTYNYTLLAGYKDLIVKLDGSAISANGNITMNSNHTLEISATPNSASYTLTVNLGPGTTGTPSTSGTYASGAVVNYSYSLLSNYKDLVVKLDGSTISASGSITMNSNHTMETSSTPVGSSSYTLTVDLRAGVTGTPSSTGTYAQGTIVNYSYTWLECYTDFSVRLDDVGVDPSGSIIMDRNHSIYASAAPAPQPPYLGGGMIVPTNGNSSTDFQWFVKYRGCGPTVKKIYIDGVPYDMRIYVSNTDYVFGPKKLPTGTHNYYIYFEDGKGNAVREPSSGTNVGPTVN